MNAGREKKDPRAAEGAGGDNHYREDSVFISLDREERVFFSPASDKEYLDNLIVRLW